MSELNPMPDMGGDERLRALSIAMHDEVLGLAIIYNAVTTEPFFKYTRPPQEALRRVAESNQRLANWPDVLDAGRRLALDTVRYTAEPLWWRLQLSMPRITFDPSVPVDEGDNTGYLTELLLWSRITPERTGNTNYPYAASRLAIRREFEALQVELSGDDTALRNERDHLPGVTWKSAINSLSRGQVRVGRNPAA